MKFTKPALTLPAQLDLLKARGMAIVSDARALRVLQNINYYRLRAYWLPFEETAAEDLALGEHRFKPHTEFDAVVALYVFDRKLRLLLLEAIERVEIALRTHWAQSLAERYGAHAYLNKAVFGDQQTYEHCLASLDEEISRSKETFVQHYRAKYTEPSRPPIWAACELLTLGQLSKWFNNVKLRSDRQDIAQKFQLDEIVACAFAHHLTHVRNLCAHHSRVWNRKLTLTMTLPKRPSKLAVHFNLQEPRRIFNTIVMLAWYMRTISPDTTWPKRMHELLKQRLAVDLRAMGAPKLWEHTFSS